ncbi:S-formylglutathione hydrolase [Marinicella sediminis]|uniref:S-formylglutathione hydrolase n=1 Tax=Marinicella sediminis TaxID=1792834 RepID=A0ABV7JIC1_9GAMM|nr:S-formylglutathione hydrolase [Marinicella sediminis]
MQLSSQHTLHDGQLSFYRHESTVNQASMGFAIYLPPQSTSKPVPVLYFLSGLTCTEENFMIKSGAQRFAAKHGIALVSMDTSPRNLGLPGEDDSYDFGSGAGFYLNASKEPWSRHYRMEDYVVKELPGLIEEHFPVQPGNRSVFGHSMGGHGALTLALKNQDKFRSVSAFSPITAPTQNEWGIKAFTGYLGDDRTLWRQYDTVELIKSGVAPMPLLVDQGLADEFLTEYLQPEKLLEVCEQHKHPLTMRQHAGYDHSYYFISSFIEDHISYHAGYLHQD